MSGPLTYRRYVVAYLFDLDGITGYEAFGCEAAGVMQAVSLTSMQLGLAIAEETYGAATLADIASQDRIGAADYRLREIRPYLLRDEVP